MPNIKCNILTSDLKQGFKDAFKHKRSYDDYHLEKLRDDVFLTETKSPYLFWANEDYPMVLVGDGRKTDLTKIGNFSGGLEEVKEALDVMTFLKGSENVYVLHLDPYTKNLYRTMVPMQKSVGVPPGLKGIKTKEEYRELQEAKRKEYETKRESEKTA